ncbi:alpha-L-rhamnosidase C-terminal domain-containing protein [Paenibacillus solisilvae]|uniref:alpha-L-rhamnosidase n=1 Tax=Paenibacillus solisilvae TaxID=2486751 RepID=A0ABW0WA83_9BACL
MTLNISRLLTEYADAPLGLDNRRPRLSWRLEAEEREQLQTAYRLLVATCPNKLERDEGDMWDSGRIESDQSIHVQYAGSPLESGAHYYWKVRVWDKRDVPSEWSRMSSWSMGPLNQADWQAKWIGMDVPHSDDYRSVAYLRKALVIRKPVKRAIVHATALGIYRLFIGGRRVSDHEFAPGWTDYKKRIQYQTYEVTSHFGSGAQKAKVRKFTSLALLVSYMGYLEGISERDMIPESRTGNYGDWLSIHADTSKELISNAFYAHSTGLMARIASVLGREEDASKFREQAQRIKEAFAVKFADPGGRLKGGTQTAYALTLSMGLLPEPAARLAACRLVEEVKASDNHVTAGFLGIPHLLPALSDYGYIDTAYDLLMQESFPSWFHQIKSGATTMWERWDGWSKERGFHPVERMNSFNHYAFGAVGEWLYRYMAGIDTDLLQPGFKHIRIAPRPGGGLTRVYAEYESMYGTIVSAWEIQDGRFRLQVRIPINTTAAVQLPGAETKVEIGSGTYAFEIRL